MPIPDAFLSASCLPDACFCEQVGSGLIRQPANTVSSLAFVLAGMVVWSLSPSEGANRLYGGALLIIGLGSAYYHARLSFVGQTLDVFGMYLLATFAVLAPAIRRGLVGRRAGVGFYLVGNLGLLLSLVFWPAARRYLFGLLVAVAVVLELFPGTPRPRWKYLGASLLALGIGAGAWALDLKRILCDPTSPLQGHAVWHTLTAASAFLLFLYYRETGSGLRPSGVTQR